MIWTAFDENEGISMPAWTDLALDPRTHRAVSLVGAGGKTTLMYALAREAAAQGLRVIVTTTTRILPHPRLPITDCTEPERLKRLLAQRRVLLAGTPAEGEKITGSGEIGPLMRAADVVLIEADGSRGLPLKAPASHEPAIPPQSSAVVAVMGADCIGRPIASACHRPELVCALLGVSPQHRILPEDAARIAASPLGGRKNVPPETAFRCAVNKADLNPASALELQARLHTLGIHAAATSFSEQERDGKCLF